MDTLRPGDTVIWDGVPTTVDGLHLTRCPFMGTAYRGDCRGLHGRKVDVALYPKWHRGELVGHVRQP